VRTTVKFYGPIKEGRLGERTALFPDGTTILEIMSSLDVPLGKGIVVLLNGKYAGDSAVPKDGDVLAFFSPIGGG
jgi:molybdopterin converting factor small subunit